MADDGGHHNRQPHDRRAPAQATAAAPPPTETRRSPRERRGAGSHSAPGSHVHLPRSTAVLVIAVAVIVVGGVLAVVVLTRPHHPSPSPVANAYLSDWTRRDFAAMALLVEDPPTTFVATHQAVVTDLGVTSWQYRLGAVKATGASAAASYSAHIVLAGFGAWNYSNSVHLALVFGHWLVEWTPATIFPSLPLGGHLALRHTWPTRASVLGVGGTVLAGAADVVSVGLQGNAVTSPQLVTSGMTQAGIDPTVIANALKQAAANPTQFTPVTDLSDARYAQVKSIIFSIPGTRFARQAGNTTATPDLAAHVVGAVGPITADELSQLGAPYGSTDTVGQVGIEAQYERQLAGTPTSAIEVVGADGTDLVAAFTAPGKAGTPVQTTIDLPTEEAAEAALTAEALPAALVAIQASTGDVLAAVSRPDTTSFDRAIVGQYPPGSTFKVITSSALLQDGLTPTSATTCPKTLTVDGKVFKNFEGEAALNIDMLQAFEVSCNTAFIGMAGNLTDQQLIAAATQFGFGAPPQPGLPAFGGQIPEPVDEVEKVADAIGQGRVLASPLQMAGVAAAVDSGMYRAPTLVVGSADATAKPISLPPAAVASLRTMMAGVVSNGTGGAADVAGPTVYGKTGTAEFGNANPPMTHAWFIGFRGDVAFAIVVEGGGVGGTVAAPIAAKFLRALGS